MEQYISKSAVVVEIEKVIDEPTSPHDPQCPWEDGYYCGLNKAENIIDTLEVKEVDLESLVRQVIDLYFKAGEHYNSVIKEERKEYGGSDLVIKLFDGVIDAKELSIQYVLDKLKAQKGEKV